MNLKKLALSAVLPKSKAGFSLVETMVAVAILAPVLMAVIITLKWATVAAVRAREELRAGRINQTIHARLQSMDFYNVFACTSTLANYGLWAAYPERATLADIHNQVRAAGFSHFTIGVTFMRRDTADSNNNGLVSDLVTYTDANGNLIDDYDPNVRYLDQNADGDYYDTYMVGPRKVAEQPDTHLKLLTIKIWKGSQTVSVKQGELLSAERFSGVENPSSEASLQLNITSPENASYLYRKITAAQINSQNTVITKSYPSEIHAYRADVTSSLRLQGNTEPVGTFSFYLGAPGVTVIDTVDSDMMGDFTRDSILLTNVLVEGTNNLYAKTTKSTLSSPYAEKYYIYDYTPPTIGSQSPTGTAKDLTPYIGCVLADTGSTTTVSGICDDVISFFFDGSTVPYQYNSATGRVIYVDATTKLPPTLVDGSTHSVRVEGGDNAFYKVMSSWTFTADIDDTDNSAPSVSNRSPIGAAAPTWPEISCIVRDNQSGVRPLSLVMKVDGVVVVSSITTPVLGDYYDPETGTVSYTPPIAFAAGTFHTVTIHAQHWATDPPDPDKLYLDPLYDVNAAWSFTTSP